MTTDALWSGRFAKIYWLFTHLIVLLVLVLRKSTLHKKLFIEFDYPYAVFFFVIFCVCTVLYFACCINPGYAVKNKGGMLQLHDEDEHNEQLQIADNDDRASDVELGVILSNKEEAQAPHLHLCTHCNIIQPIRTKHCNECERCVSRYDHHCFFVGGCVGQKNHSVFWLYLLVQSFLIAWAFVMVVPDGFTDTSTISGWFYTNGLALVVSVVLFTMFFLPFGLWLFHSYLMLTNQTTWEVSKRRKITYLQELPEEVFPFDNGCLANIREFLTMRYNQIEWIVVEPEISNRGFNIWTNKYWSCF